MLIRVVPYGPFWEVEYEYIKPPTQAAQIKRIMQLVECFQQYQASMQ